MPDAFGRMLDSERATAFTNDETGWLCELPSTAFGPSWWCAPEHEWTKDASKALRFARKQDAEDYIAEIGEWTDVIATEHMWTSPSSMSEVER